MPSIDNIEANTFAAAVGMALLYHGYLNSAYSANLSPPKSNGLLMLILVFLRTYSGELVSMLVNRIV